MQPLTAHYIPGLVVVSVMTSIVAAYATLSLADSVRAAVSRGVRRVWMAACGLALGVGVWTMHYLGMLALMLPVPVYYHWPTVVLSLVLAILSSAIAIMIATRERLTVPRMLGGGVLMGTGFGVMHYVGMAAMRMRAMEEYIPWVVVAAVVVAMGFSCLALWIAFANRTPRSNAMWVRLGAGVVLGLGMASTHYIAMAGVRFEGTLQPFSMSHTLKVDWLGAAVIAVVTGLILLMAVGTAALDKLRFLYLEVAHAELVEAQQALIGSQDQLRRANAKLSELTLRDPLTGLYNRRHLDTVLQTETSRSARNQKPIALLLIDIDHFKALNDTFGHLHGDTCLRAVATVLEEYPRRGYDVAARYGGEEFIVLLPEADGMTANAVAEQIRQAVWGLQIAHPGTAAGVVTVSIGVCSVEPQPGDDPNALVREADQALYEAKRRGRNRVELASDLAMPA